MNDTTNNNNLEAELAILVQELKEAEQLLAKRDAKLVQQDILCVANSLKSNAEKVLNANAIDVQSAKEKEISPNMIDRLTLSQDAISSMVNSLQNIATIESPVGKVLDSWAVESGLNFEKVSVPLGVIGMIYESRPNVTIDAFAICYRSHNVCLLRGGSEIKNTNSALKAVIKEGLEAGGGPLSACTVIESSDRAYVKHMLSGLNGSIDLLIPRGGAELVARVKKESKVPVLAHLEGICHTYISKDADFEKASQVVVNAKLRRTSICGALECLVLDNSISEPNKRQILLSLASSGCEVRCSESLASIDPSFKIAKPEDFGKEHLEAVISVKEVNNLEEAINFINSHGSGHTDCIITNNPEEAQVFCKEVNSAIVMHNTSTQFADGGEFGFGAEIGIATGKVHARGPVSVPHLVTYKYKVSSDYAVRG